MLAKVYRQRIKTPDDPPGMWFWYWTETDDLGESEGDPNGPHDDKQSAIRAAHAAGFEVTVPARRVRR